MLAPDLCVTAVMEGLVVNETDAKLTGLRSLPTKYLPESQLTLHSDKSVCVFCSDRKNT